MTTVAMCPNGQTFITGDEYGKIDIYEKDAKMTWKMVQRFESNKKDENDGGSDANEDDVDFNRMQVPEYTVESIKWSANNRAAVVQFEDCGVRVVRRKPNGQGWEIKIINGEHIGPTVQSVALSYMGKHLAVGDDAGRIRIIDVDNNTYRGSLGNRDGRTGWIMSLNFHPNVDFYLMSGCTHGNAKLWDLRKDLTVA